MALGGDGRAQGSPLWVIPLGPDGQPETGKDPILSTVTDQVTGKSQSVISVDAGLNGAVVIDTQTRNLLEKILMQLTILNTQIGTLVAGSGASADGSPDDSGI